MSDSIQALRHGGDLRAAARAWGIPLEHWLDLSTGVNPNPWPLPPLPTTLASRLPEGDDGLEEAAAAYYGSDALLATPGSQAVLQWLPRALVEPGRVAITTPGYAEHARAWRAAGHEVIAVPPEGPERLDGIDTLVVIQPNNPTGAVAPEAQLRHWRQTLAARGGHLILDEAFADTPTLDGAPIPSLAAETGEPGLVVLRSLGKFFGLAGLRVGFCLGPAELRVRLADHLGPWPVNGIGRWAVRQALGDRDWQARTRTRLTAAARRLDALLAEAGLEPMGNCPLFRWVRHPNATALEDRLARAAIRVRRFDDPAALRFGLPATEEDWARLAEALAGLPT